jgi:hypothetical protein
LFFHICPDPDLLVDPKAKRWESIGLEIRDKLSTGQLKIWGRIRANWEGKRSNLSPIAPEYWKPQVDFTYWFLEEGHEYAFHVNPPTRLELPGYSDLRVNKAQALTIWPEAVFERNPESKDAALLLLTRLRADGVALRNEAEYVQDASLRVWLESIEQWMHDVINAISQVHEADSEWFKTLDTVPPPRIPIKSLCTKQTDRNVHLHVYRQHDFRLVRLEQLLKKYGVAAS